MRLGLWLAAALGLLGCASADSDAGPGTDDFIDMDTPPGNCSAGTTGMPCPDPGQTTGVPEGGACLDSTDCASGTSCIAPFVDGEVGDFVCTSQCIGLMDESAWCLDASACCDAGATCNPRGLCIEGALDDSGSGTASDGTASDGTTSTGGTTTGSNESSGSGTTAATGTTGGMSG